MMRLANRKKIMMGGFLLAAGLALVNGAQQTTRAAQPEEVTIRNNSNISSIDCKGRPVKIFGNSNVITVLGKCPLLTIGGNSNVIQVEKAESIFIGGNSNVLKYVGGISRTEPDIENAGNSNIVTRVAKVSPGNPSIKVTNGNNGTSNIELNSGLGAGKGGEPSIGIHAQGPDQANVHIGVDGIRVQSTNGNTINLGQ